MATPERGNFSRTIRIDLISDLESKAAKGQKIVVAGSTARHRRVRTEGDADGRGLFFNELLPRHALKGEGEVLAIGGDYLVKATYH